ncbi:MAG: hypothetical protein WCF44_13725 [Candidatus Methylophosphatis roskildensis]|jgi:hypothetical protein|nr:hypothetical protein [Acidimicrobiia bacterium]MDQ1240837.1 hypothetical protein [Pseudomonadota bacterium]MDQ1249878.1 hypothetical protein [Actinomycetota bacterium]MDQ1309308.1 hypothetical protein [Pseudomonadota bacterium]
MIDFQVFQGPGNRIVAVSTQPVGEHWTVKDGTQGTRLRISQWPLTKYPTLDALKSAFLSPQYTHLYTGHVDTHGNSASVSTKSVIFWEIRGAAVESLRRDLVLLADELAELGSTVRVSDDAIGLVLCGSAWKFGVTAKPQHHCIAAQDGNGAGTLLLAQAPELLALLCALSSNHPFAFADRDGKAVSVKQVLELGSRFVPTALVPFIKKRGNAPLSFYVKTVGRPQVLF